MKHTFTLRVLTCARCKANQTPSRWVTACRGCGGRLFTIEIERSASGIEVSMGGVGGGGLVSLAVDDDDGPGMTFFRTHAFLRCRNVSGNEIAEFLRASLERRRKLYIGWKRREVESGLGPDQAICDRCRVAFKVYKNEWNRSGFCSKSCRAADLKSRKS